jgi:hypothetical protein
VLLCQKLLQNKDFSLHKKPPFSEAFCVDEMHHPEIS